MHTEDIESMSAQAGITGQLAQNEQIQQQYFENQERGLVETQIDVEEIKEEFYHWLKKDRKKYEKYGAFLGWEELTDKKQRTFTDYGIEQIMQIIDSYVNKNTLLS